MKHGETVRVDRSGDKNSVIGFSMQYAEADTGFRKRGSASNSGRKTAGGIQGTL